MAGQIPLSPDRPLVQALGDSALLVRFGSHLDAEANRRAVSFARAIEKNPIPGIVEIVPSLVSVFLRYDPLKARHADIEGEIRLALAAFDEQATGQEFTLNIRFDGPDFAEVAEALSLSTADFVALHNRSPLLVLTTGFAPGFVYCGFHPETLVLPRRGAVRPQVRAGSVLFAAGQTAIAATDIPTGWHVIGHTDFSNFDPLAEPPTRLSAGDTIRFEAL